VDKPKIGLGTAKSFGNKKSNSNLKRSDKKEYEKGKMVSPNEKEPKGEIFRPLT